VAARSRSRSQQRSLPQTGRADRGGRHVRARGDPRARRLFVPLRAARRSP